jgi:hypothetical protein
MRDNVQNAKDTFYEVLRSRLAALNPERTIVLRGVTRPGVLVEENELVSATTTPDCFRLAWIQDATDANGAMPMIAMQCEIRYDTAGTAFNGGMDRGRSLAAMDGELLTAVNAAPQSAVKMNYTGLPQGKAAMAMSTNIWWSDAALGKTVAVGDRIARSATVTVMSYQEAGEL